MAIDTERISGYADALQTVESGIRGIFDCSTSALVKPGLEVALAIIEEARVKVSEYYEYLCDLREDQNAEWGAWAETETDCVPCLAETAPHTCVQPW